MISMKRSLGFNCCLFLFYIIIFFGGGGGIGKIKIITTKRSKFIVESNRRISLNQWFDQSISIEN